MSEIASPLSADVPDADPSDEAPIDPAYVEIRYRYHRAQRRRRVRRRQESRLAHYRFYIALSVLVALAVAFVVGAWLEIQHLFGI